MEYYVFCKKLMYKEGTSAEAKEITIPKCGKPCVYSKFVEIVKPYKPTDWEYECRDLSATVRKSHFLSSKFL